MQLLSECIHVEVDCGYMGRHTIKGVGRLVQIWV